MVENHHGAQFHLWVKIEMPTTLTYRAIDTNPKGNVLKRCSFFVKNRQDMKKRLKKIATIV